MRFCIFLIVFVVLGSVASADFESELLNVEKQHCEIIQDSATPCPSAFTSICQAFDTNDAPLIQRVSEHCAALPEIEVESTVQIFLDAIRPHYKEIAAALIAMLLAILALLKTKLEGLKKRASEAFNRLADPFFEEKYEYDSRALNVVLVGEGGSGKTTLIHSLTAAPEAVPAIGTNAISTYSLVQEMTVMTKKRKVRRLFRIFIDDYEGQRFVDALKSKEINSRLTKVPATLLVLVVDLFKLDKSKKSQLRDKIDRTRVKEQLDAYHDNVLQIILDRVSSAEHLVLFINKIDMLSPMTPENYESAEKVYKKLIDRLNQVRGKQLHIIVGSARAGIGVVGYDEGQSDQKSLLQIMHDACKPLPTKVK